MKITLKILIAVVMITRGATAEQFDVEKEHQKAQANYDHANAVYLQCKTLYQSDALCSKESEQFDKTNTRLLIYSFLGGCTEDLKLTPPFKNNPQAAGKKCLEETKYILGMIPAELKNIEQELKK